MFHVQEKNYMGASGSSSVSRAPSASRNVDIGEEIITSWFLLFRLILLQENKKIERIDEELEIKKQREDEK